MTIRKKIHALRLICEKYALPNMAGFDDAVKSPQPDRYCENKNRQGKRQTEKIPKFLI